MLLDAAVLGQQLRVHLPGLLLRLRAHRLQLGGVLLEFLVVGHLQLVELQLGLGRAHADLLLLAVLGVRVLAHLGELLLVAGKGIQQLAHRLGLLLHVLGGLRRVVLQLLGERRQYLLQPFGFILHGLEPVLHDGHVVLQLLHVRLLIPQEIALLQQLLAIGRLAHFRLEAVGLHIHLHELPQGIQLHTNSLHLSEKHFRFAL